MVKNKMSRFYGLMCTMEEVLSVDCDTLNCQQFCINDGERRGHCICKEGYTLQSDGHCSGIYIFILY